MAIRASERTVALSSLVGQTRAYLAQLRYSYDELCLIARDDPDGLVNVITAIMQAEDAAGRLNELGTGLLQGRR